MREKRFVAWYWIRLLLAVLSVCAVLPILWIGAIPKDIQPLALKACGGMFWGSLLLELITLVPSSLLYRSLEPEYKKVKIRWRGAARMGIVSFCRTTSGMIVDAATVILSMFVIFLYASDAQNAWLIIPMIVLALLAWNLHALINGKNRYLYLKIKRAHQKRRRAK